VTPADPAQPLKNLQPQHEFFVGVDSDGSVFDSMGIKERECFCPWMIAHFDLQPVAEAARECKDFADLFSRTRGGNRHVTLKRILTELLPSHPQVKARGFAVPQLPHYFAWVDDPNSVLSNDGLRQAIDRADSEARGELQRVLAWSERSDWAVGEIVRNLPLFPFVRESLEKMQATADLVVVSSTPVETLQHDWKEHDIARYMAVIAGQEMGTKIQHLAYAAKDRYNRDHVLLIGDAPGDLQAARASDALFYPIVPGREAESWERFHDEAFDRFLTGRYAGKYEAGLIPEFDAALSDDPPWI
jgi:phosphoglycolate phosphatase-like HAD superfamily hydrolase